LKIASIINAAGIMYFVKLLILIHVLNMIQYSSFYFLSIPPECQLL
jgi:hypothetical protein